MWGSGGAHRAARVGSVLVLDGGHSSVGYLIDTSRRDNEEASPMYEIGEASLCRGMTLRD
jgi:hypothetical protein